MSIRGRPPGFSPFVCLRSANRLYASKNCISYHTNVPRLCGRRTVVFTCQSLYQNPPNVTRGQHARQTKFSSCRQFSQATEAVQEDSYEPSAMEHRQPFTDLEQSTVKELRHLLASRSLKTMGTKKELIERLQAVAQNNTSSTEADSNEDAPPTRAAPSVDQHKGSGGLSKLTVKELRGMLAERGLSTQGVKAQLIERLESSAETSSLDGQVAESNNDSTALQDATSQETDSTNDSWISQIEREVLFAEQQAAIFASRLSIVCCSLGLSEVLASLRVRSLNQAALALSLCGINSSLLDIELSALRISLVLSMILSDRQLQLIFQRLEASNTQITALENQIAAIRSEPSSLSPSTTTILPSSPTTTHIDNLHQRLIQISAEVYFTKMWLQLLNDPKPAIKQKYTKLVREHPRDEHFLRKAYLNHVRIFCSPGRKVVEEDMHHALLLALDDLYARRKTSRTRVSDRVKILPEVKEVAKAIPKDESSLEDAEHRKRISRNQILAEICSTLSESSATLPIQLSDTLRHRYPRKSDSDAAPGEFFNPMWQRLDLLDHVQAISPGVDDAEYLVTFRTFNAAAAFVNQVDAHWLDDKMTGQVYATWIPLETKPNNVVATVSFPRATIEPWRNSALIHGAGMSNWKFPLVDWGRSFMSVLQRMKLVAGGKKGDCRYWTVTGEYGHVVIMEAAFSDPATMKRFVASKSQHYLSNPWKDRFFVKQKDRYTSIVGE